MTPDLERVLAYLKNLQDEIETGFKAVEGQPFKQDEWQHKSGGGGRTRVIENGDAIEKGGVNFSHVKGSALPPSASAMRPEIAGKSFEATGVSLVMHPHNPMAPTAHMNVRFFIADKDADQPVWWFGGGFDLTPYYGFTEDCKHWHHTASQACCDIAAEEYDRLKAWCDEYFYLTHRKEPRGIGGLFFDDYTSGGFDAAFAFLQKVGNAFMTAYIPILQKRVDMPFTPAQREFQLYRRGRYVEFNLVHDRGTIFGLQSGGRTESILMSMPPQVSWRYNWQPEPGSEEARLYDYFLQPRNWATLDVDSAVAQSNST